MKWLRTLNAHFSINLYLFFHVNVPKEINLFFSLIYNVKNIRFSPTEIFAHLCFYCRDLNTTIFLLFFIWAVMLILHVIFSSGVYFLLGCYLITLFSRNDASNELYVYVAQLGSFTHAYAHAYAYKTHNNHLNTKQYISSFYIVSSITIWKE